MDKLISIGNLNSQPIATVLRKISVISIGALFYAYHTAIPAGTKTSLFCRSFIAMVVVLFKNDGSIPLITPCGYAWQGYHNLF